MPIRNCKGCGTIFDAATADIVYCDTCRNAARRATVLRDRICRSCGVTFPGGPRAWYCPACRIDRQRDAGKRYKRSGAARPLGSTDTCARCEGSFIVVSGRQKYCPACADEAVREVVRPVKRVYNADHKAEQTNRRHLLRQDLAVCRICGKSYTPTTKSDLCSDACRAIAKKQAQQRADAKRSPRKKGGQS